MKYTIDNWRKAKGIVKYVLDHSDNDSTDRLNTLQVITDGIKTGTQWAHGTLAERAQINIACTLSVRMLARYLWYIYTINRKG